MSANAAWKPRVNPWLIAFVVSLAAFMEVLDTSIANVALPHIAGNLGASSDESTWVLTSYLVSNAIVLPITGWLVSVIGRKRFFLICISLFTVSSLFCGIAPSLPILLLSRVIQGAGGGGLQPMAQAILADTFPPEKRGLAFSVYGVTAVVAPSIGPTLGGWITDNSRDCSTRKRRDSIACCASSPNGPPVAGMLRRRQPAAERVFSGRDRLLLSGRGRGSVGH